MASEIVKFIDIDINKVYAPLTKYMYQNPDCTVLLYGGFGSGKSHFAAIIFLLRLLGSKELYGAESNDVAIRKNFTDVKGSQFEFILKIAKKYDLLQYVKYRNSNPRCLYTTESKSRIFAAGTSDIESFKSKTPNRKY